MSLKLGKLPARKNSIQFKLDRFLDKTKLPKPPAAFWSTRNKFTNWGLFKNDEIGDCVWAGAANETMQWAFEAGSSVVFSDENVISSYSNVTGYDPNQPWTDNGTDMQQAASYRRKVGLEDIHGVVHQVEAYVALKAGDYDQLKLAMWLFGGCGVGIMFPRSAMDQFERGEPWDVVKRTRIEGGHYIPAFGVNEKGNIMVVSWGKVQEMTPAFYEKYCDEGVVYFDDERLKENISPEGFDQDLLLEYLEEVK